MRTLIQIQVFALGMLDQKGLNVSYFSPMIPARSVILRLIFHCGVNHHDRLERVEVERKTERHRETPRTKTLGQPSRALFVREVLCNFLIQYYVDS